MRLVLFATLAVTAVGCVFGSSESFGPCSPEQKQPFAVAELIAGAPGESPAGELRIPMRTGAAGECDHLRTHWLSLDGGVQEVTFDQTVDGTRMNRVSGSHAGISYIYAGQATLTLERPTLNTVKVTVDFTTGPAFTRTCTTSLGKSVVCQ